jgi:predicted transcriptional regulator
MTIRDWSNTVFGRSEILALLEKRVNDLTDGYRQNIAIIGQRFIGKTYLIQHFLSGLNNDRFVYIYIEPESFEFRVFARKFIGSLLNSVSRSHNLAGSNDLDILINENLKIVPRTVEHAKKILGNLDKEKNSDIYNDLIDLPDIFTRETGKVCLVIFDEFHDIIESLNVENAYHILSKKITVQRKCMYIILGSLRYKAKKILTEKLSLLFGNFEVIELRSFDIKTSKDFIDLFLEGKNMPDPLKNFLFDLTSGQPFYLEVICREILRLTSGRATTDIGLSDLSISLSNLMNEACGLLNLHFRNYLNEINEGKSGHFLLSIILSIARGKRKINDIASYLHRQKILISQKINRLLELDILSKNGNFYYLTDKMFNFWLKYIYIKRLDSIENFDITHSPDYCKVDIENAIESFMRVSQRAISERLIELFNLFENESVQMNGYKYRLFRFKEINPIIFKDLNNHGLIAHSKNILWLILFKEDTLSEQDVSRFIAACKNFKHKPQRRIIVALGLTDSNTKLRALQEKVWIWNIEELNLFLNLHDKHCIVK